MTTDIPILNKFLYYLLCVKNYSKQTVIGYSRDLQRFFKFIIEFLELDIDLSQLSVFILGRVEESTIIEFFVYLNYYENNGANSRKRILNAIKAFYKWLFLDYSLTLENYQNPTLKLPSIGGIERLPKYIELEEAKKLECIFNESNSQYPVRNNTIMILFLNCGLRLSELISINRSDINFTAKELKVIGKGNKERIVYLNTTCIAVLNKYLELRDDNFEPLFINNKNNRLNISGVEGVCKKAFKLANLSKYNYTVHTLRHTSATYLYKSTKDILVVKNFLGHKSVVSTEIYTHLLDEELKRAVDSNPLNNIL